MKLFTRSHVRLAKARKLARSLHCLNIMIGRKARLIISLGKPSIIKLGILTVFAHILGIGYFDFARGLRILSELADAYSVVYLS